MLTASKATFASASEAISWILVLFASFRMVSNHALVWGKKTRALIWITMDSPYVWSHHLWFTNSDSTQIALHFCEYFINSRLNLEKSKFNSSSLSYCSFPFRPYENSIFLQLRTFFMVFGLVFQTLNKLPWVWSRKQQNALLYKKNF